MKNIDGVNLDDDECKIVEDCLRASVQGPFFPDEEFNTIFGLTRMEVSAVLSRWPTIQTASKSESAAIRSSLNNLVGYPHGQEDAWGKYIAVDENAIQAILSKWSSTSSS